MLLTKKIARNFSQFWFAPRSCESLAVWRIVFGTYVLHLLLISLPNWARYYGVQGTYPLSILRQEQGDFWTIFALSDSAVWIWVVYTVLIAAAVLLTLGLFTRIACVLLFLGHSSMMARNIYMVNGQDQVATMLLFFACFAPLNGAFSLDRKRQGKAQLGELESSWAVRLMQVSFAGIYLFCGPSKWQTWSDGNAMYYISLSYAWFRYPGMELFRDFQTSRILSYSTIAIESLFPFLVWFPSFRPWMLLAVALLHIGCMVFLSPAVFYFNLIMVIGLLLFVDGRTVRSIYRERERRRKYERVHEG